ncbi:hypothetical protein B0T17DRAFT_585395 [Bombardia bombarda]|uniref:Peptidase S8/S53 domain-containing protein n=1 Tax=Bombardia bombarda TaxID=252184 RepID=A0AA39U357_9PEZI|nr:hypothetical protein B0T17DRAFT_585395 [Bombardia bombarda]
MSEADIVVVQVLVDSEPFLAFENPSQSLHSSKDGGIWMEQCQDVKKHWQSKEKGIPFHRAAAHGNDKAIKHMIDSLERYCKDDIPGKEHHLLLNILRRPDSQSSPRETALQKAAKAEQRNLKTLEVLLVYPDIAKPPDKTFESAVDRGASKVVEALLNHEELRESFVTSNNIIHAMDKIFQKEDGDDRGPGDRISIVNSLVQHARTKEVFNMAVVEKIIGLNLREVWDKRHKDVQLDKSGLLHLAVCHQNLDFVKIFVAEYPDTVSDKAEISRTDGGDHYPLWFHNRKWDSSTSPSKWVPPEERKKVRDEIRNEIVNATIRRTDKMQKLSEILQESAVGELCFDISLFNSKSYLLRDFVHSLVNHRENMTLLKYEPTIKYAKFPAMDLHPDDKEVFGDTVQHDHREVFDVLKWLRADKGVTSVTELTVLDRLVNPHNELRIARCVKDFGVEILNWRFLDLSLSEFDTDKVKPKIRSLHLYASGKRAVMRHWVSEQGLVSFPNLSWVTIHVIQDTMTAEYCQKTCKFLRKKLGRLAKLKNDQMKSFEYEVISQPWNPKHEGLTDLEELAKRAFPKLSHFILSYRALVSRIVEPAKFTPTKIAIIDNGIMSISPAPYDSRRDLKRSQNTGPTRRDNAADIPYLRQQDRNGTQATHNHPQDAETSAAETDDDENESGDSGNPTRLGESKSNQTLWSRIEQGRSFVDNDFQLSPWLFASDPHGTQMANLICAMDPACRIYVAKVMDGRAGINPDRVAKAIQWAIEQKVDIISMSFAMLEKSDDLEKAIKKANADGIVLLCSTHDEGSNIGKAWPADFTETLTIAACDEYGKLHRTTEAGSYQYMLQGLNVAAGVIPFLESTDKISGSSVATAIVAGLSSLIISCIRRANPNQEFVGVPLLNQVKDRLDKMLSSKESKYILLEKFGGIDQKIKSGEPINAEVVLSTKAFIL